MADEQAVPEGMKEVSFEGEVREYQGKKLEAPIKYSGKALAYVSIAAAKASEDWLSENQIRQVINNKLLTAAKASKYQEQTADLKAAYESSWEYQRANFIKVALATKQFSLEEAEALVDSRKPVGV